QESGPLVPDHFSLLIGDTEVAFPISQWNQDLTSRRLYLTRVHSLSGSTSKRVITNCNWQLRDSPVINRTDGRFQLRLFTLLVMGVEGRSLFYDLSITSTGPAMSDLLQAAIHPPVIVMRAAWYTE